jgi:hypothetical protein
LLDLTSRGVMVLSPPTTFVGSVTGIAFELDGDVFRTNAFSSGPLACGSVAGTYHWSLTDDRLVLTPLDEPCARRATLFGRTWQRL